MPLFLFIDVKPSLMASRERQSLSVCSSLPVFQKTIMKIYGSSAKSPFRQKIYESSQLHILHFMKTTACEQFTVHIAYLVILYSSFIVHFFLNIVKMYCKNKRLFCINFYNLSHLCTAGQALIRKYYLCAAVSCVCRTYHAVALNAAKLHRLQISNDHYLLANEILRLIPLGNA